VVTQHLVCSSCQASLAELLLWSQATALPPATPGTLLATPALGRVLLAAFTAARVIPAAETCSGAVTAWSRLLLSLVTLAPPPHGWRYLMRLVQPLQSLSAAACGCHKLLHDATPPVAD
jgi:hypothetical protein